MSGLLRQSWLRHDSTCSCYWGCSTLGITAFPTLGPLRIVFTLGVTRYTLYGVGCRLYHNGKNSSHGMIVVWLLQSDTNLQLFYESKKSFLKYFCFQPPNLCFSTPKLTFRAWERPKNGETRAVYAASLQPADMRKQEQQQVLKIQRFRQTMRRTEPDRVMP